VRGGGHFHYKLTKRNLILLDDRGELYYEVYKRAEARIPSEARDPQGMTEAFSRQGNNTGALGRQKFQEFLGIYQNSQKFLADRTVLSTLGNLVARRKAVRERCQ